MGRRFLAALLALLLLAGGCTRRPEIAAEPVNTPEATPAVFGGGETERPAVTTATCSHARWENGQCVDCGLICLHESWTDGVCDVCGYACPHTSHNRYTGKCRVCGEQQRHCFYNGVCACGARPKFETRDLPEALLRPCREQGTLERVTYTTHNYPAERYYGVIEEFEKNMTVYLPYGYNEEERYNVLILLHGLGGSEEYWLGEEQEFGEWSGNMVRTTDMLDNLIYNGYCDKLIVVAPTFYKDELDYTNYDPVNDAELFWPELRHDIMPYVAEHYATWAEDSSEEAIAAARDHFGYVGLSMGSIIGFRSAMAYCLDLFSWFGCLSGYGSDAYHLNLHLSTEEFQDLPIHYLYNGCGTMDAAWEEHRKGYYELTAICDRLTDGENAAFVEVEYVKHEFKGWLIGLYNCLQVFYNLPDTV